MVYIDYKQYIKAINKNNNTYMKNTTKRLDLVLPKFTFLSKLITSKNIIEQSFTVDFAIELGTNEERSGHFAME